MAELVWAVAPVEEDTAASLYALVAEVAALGGAVGWMTVPTRAQVDSWLAGVLATGARLVLACEGGTVLGCGYWQRQDGAVLRQNAEVRKVMTLPAARGRGVARQVVAALVADADAAGVEALSLDVRGNNHGAIGLYTSLGFVVTGRRPDWIAVADERFDQVLLHKDLRLGRPAAQALVRRGSRRAGPGST